MKLFQPDGSVLMDVAGVAIDGDRILITGKIMGAMPMKAVLKPVEARAFMQQLGLKRILQLGWFLLRGR